MTSSLLADAFAHHAWATARLLDACEALTPEQLETLVPGTYGPILDTLRHLVASDGWYLVFFRDGVMTFDDEAEKTLGLAELRSAANGYAAGWAEVLASAPDPDADLVEVGGGWEFHAPAGVRLAQAIHHGTDHRSQVCTALTGLGVEPPEIDVWAWAEATGRTREERIAAPGATRASDPQT